MLLCLGGGIGLGKLGPQLAVTLDGLSVYQVSIPITVCHFFMMYPIMVKIDFAQINRADIMPNPSYLP